MPLQVLGINHTTAPVAIREQVVIPDSRLVEALQDLHDREGIIAAIIVSTCNRTEMYCETRFDDITPLTRWLATYHKLDPKKLTKFIYKHQHEKAVQHVLRVASGLDSMILGEPQILGQLKNAYQTALNAGTLGIHLDRLFQHTFSVAKRIRSETRISANPVSVAYAAVTLGKQIFAHYAEQTALLIGAGETIELVIRHLHNQGIKRIIVANRSYERAHHLACEVDGYAIALNEIDSHLAEADIVISSTASEEPLIHYKQVKQAIKTRRHRPIFMVDIAVPRDIHPDVAELDDIYLYTVDDLQDIVQDSLKSRQAAAGEAEDMIREYVNSFMGWIRTRDAVPTIRSIRDWADTVKSEVTEKAQRMAKQGRNSEEIIDYITHNLTNKLIHSPCTRLREAGFQQERDIIEAARALFAIDENNKKDS